MIRTLKLFALVCAIVLVAWAVRVLEWFGAWLVCWAVEVVDG